MPRAEVGSQKWLANKMKAKGLQKLKWYCQMCEKQCRDENGFKCHRLSEGHQRMMQVFCQNAGRFMDGFSKAFEHEFMKLMRTRYCKTKILANAVYQEVISDKQHVHMNATVWVTLSEFVLYLGRSGKCKVEDTPRGWMIEYIDQDKIRRDQDAESKRKREISLEQRHQRLIQKMVEEARKRGGFQEPEYTPLMKEGDEKVRIETKLVKPAVAPPGGGAATTVDNKKGNIFKELCKTAKPTSSAAATSSSATTAPPSTSDESQKPTKEASSNKKRRSAIETIMDQYNLKRHMADKDASNSPIGAKEPKSCTGKQSWLMKGLHVKIILQSHPLYKHKCRVIKTLDGGLQAIVQDVNGSSNYQVDEKHVETVVPSVGSKVMVVRGPHRGSTGTLKESRPSDLLASIKLDGGSGSGTMLENVQYDDFSKID